MSKKKSIKKKLKKETTEEFVGKVVNEAVSIIVTTIANAGSGEFLHTKCVADVNGKKYDVEINIDEIKEVKKELKKV